MYRRSNNEHDQNDYVKTFKRFQSDEGIHRIHGDYHIHFYPPKEPRSLSYCKQHVHPSIHGFSVEGFYSSICQVCWYCCYWHKKVPYSVHILLLLRSKTRVFVKKFRHLLLLVVIVLVVIARRRVVRFWIPEESHTWSHSLRATEKNNRLLFLLVLRYPDIHSTLYALHRIICHSSYRKSSKFFITLF